MKLRAVIYSLFLVTLLVGCGDRINMRQLERLEARVNDAPDSVLAVLAAADIPHWGVALAAQTLFITIEKY